ncbi:MAG TPA: hypothetical protein VFC39_09670, partial [Acidobacteriaceae bacterium]|nr:hypothetical protein [Acidobacteriaceae bacterium]
MRRFLSLVVLLFITVPFGASLAGCGNKTVVQFCSGGDSGPVVGQVKTITLSPNFAIYGESLNFGQIGSGLSASAVDCKGSPVSVRSFTYASSDLSFADINPASGAVCAGTYNRFTGGGIPDYTLCNPPTGLTASITAFTPSANISPSPTSVVTLTAKNSFAPGQQVTFIGLTAGSFLNGQTLPVVSVSPSGDSFTVNAVVPPPPP